MIANFNSIDNVFKYTSVSSLYYFHEFQDYLSLPLNHLSLLGQDVIKSLNPLFSFSELETTASANLEMVERSTHRYEKPTFNIEQVTSTDGNIYNIEEKIIAVRPFCQLIHFKRHQEDNFKKGQNHKEKFPPLLIVAPYSGHYATLLRDTCQALLKDHDVYITDWANARDVPLYQGNFNLEDYIEYLKDFIYILPEDLHILAVCQPAVPVLALTALMAADHDPRQPKSIILMGGPIDTRRCPTAVNKIAQTHTLEWYHQNVIGYVPLYYPGAFRAVCPGFLMLSGFINLNNTRHLEASFNHYKYLVDHKNEKIEAHRKFYNEYRSVLDLPADYFLDSVKVAFQDHSLPQGKYIWKGQKVDPKAIHSTAILAVEGEKDDMSGIGQTLAALDICENVPSAFKHYHLQKDVGHYGVFSGRRFREEIVPVISGFIRNAASHKIK